jgi:hypothetical protein
VHHSTPQARAIPSPIGRGCDAPLSTNHDVTARMLDARRKSLSPFPSSKSAPPRACRNGTSRPALRHRPSSVPPYALRKFIHCVPIGHPPFGVRLGRKWSLLTEHASGSSRAQVSDVAHRCCAIPKPPVGSAVVPDIRREATTIRVVPSDCSGHRSSGRPETGEGPISPGSDPVHHGPEVTRRPVVIAGACPDGDGAIGVTPSSFLQTSCSGGVRQLRQMQLCRVSR